MGNRSGYASKSAAAIRLNSYLAKCGLGSRRKCEEIIRSGVVAIAGKTVRELATQVNPGTDTVTVRGKAVSLGQKIHLAFHKPADCLCTRPPRLRRGEISPTLAGWADGKRDKGRTIYDLLPPEYQSLFYVGRLDRDTEGLLFLTNDGAWAERIAHPRNEVKKVYVAEILGRPDERDLRRLVHGVRDEGETLRAESVRLLDGKAANPNARRVQITLLEGKKREIRRMFRALHHPVVFLKRVQIGDLSLGGLASGKWRLLTDGEVARF